MISFFKYQDLLRLALIFILLGIIRLPVFIYGYPWLLPEVLWQATGARLSEGFIMYRDVLENIDPLSAGTYFITSKLFGDSQEVYQVLSLILVFVQAMLLNFILNLNNLYSDRTYVPALMYVVLSSLFFDFYTLSPVMLGTTFLLLALHFILLLIRTGDNQENIFYTGILTGLATLFYMPLFVFMFLTILAFLLYTPASFRKYLILFTGFIFPFLLTGTYYFLRNGLTEFQECILYPFKYKTVLLVSLQVLLYSLILPVIFLVGSFFSISANSRYINYQHVGVRIFGFWLVFSVLTFYFTGMFSSIQLFVLVPGLAFFLAHFFLLAYNRYIREIGFLVLLITILSINYSFLRDFSKGKIPESYKAEVVQPVVHFPFELKNQKVLVLGEDKAYYLYNKAATPYLNWTLSKRDFTDLQNYENLSKIYDRVSKDMPDVIVDQHNIAPGLFGKIPLFRKEYIQARGYNVYIRKGPALTNTR